MPLRFWHSLMYTEHVLGVALHSSPGSLIENVDTDREHVHIMLVAQIHPRVSMSKHARIFVVVGCFAQGPDRCIASQHPPGMTPKPCFTSSGLRAQESCVT